MSYPILYQSGETNFNHQGLGVLFDSISAVVSEDLNGKFELDLTYAYNNSLSKFLINGNVIKVDAGNILKEQLFTIVQVSKVIDGKVSVHAEHISYITNDLTLKPKTVVYQQNAQGALNQFVKTIKETNHGITVYSDVQTISSSTWSVPDFKKPRDILGGVDGSILDNWGGEYKFDNRRISLLQQRGSYANIVIAYGRNMTEFEQESNILETVTSIYPVVVKTDKDVETIYTLPELAVDSQYLDRYANRKTLLVDFSDKFDDKNPYSETKLRALANKYIKDNKVGIPKVTLTVSTIDLSKMLTNDYDASRVERLDLADIVKVYFDKLGITTEAKVVGVKWNVLKDAYDEYTLGERKATFGSIIRGSISEVKSVANSAKKNAITALISADSKNTNYYGNSSDGEPTNPKKGDIWFVKDGDKTIIKTWNGTSWVDLVSSDWQEIFNAKLTEELTKAKVELDAALLEKDIALAALDVKLAANEAVLNQAKSDLADNKEKIESVSNDLVANTQEQANLKVSLSDLDIALAETSSEVATATTSIATVKTEVATATTTANEAVAKADGLLTRVSKAETSIIQMDGQIKLKANQTSLDSLTGRVSETETSITQQDKVIQLKANQTSLDSLTGKMITAESKITQMATDINLRVTNDDIINQINIAPEGVLISANKLMIQTTGNLIRNSEFQSNSWRDNWGFSNNQTTPINFTNGGEYADYQGGASDRASVDTNDVSKYSSSGGVYIFQDFSVQSGIAYSFSYMIAVNLYTNGMAAGWIRWYDSSGSAIGTDTPYLIQNSVTSPVWIRKKSENLIAPSGAVKARFYFKNEGNLRSYITRIMVNRGTKVMPYISTSGEVYVYGNMIVDGAVTASSLAANSVIAGKIGADAVTTATIAAGAITTVKLAANAVTAETISAGAVIADKIGAGAITTVKLAANAVTADKISVNNLAAINGNLGTLTAGVIDAAAVTVKNINASNVTTGILSADRIAANSITAAHISISSLSALSANLGVITAGTINAATVNIININAASITTGTLNADRIGANSITADKIKATSLDLFSNDSYTNIRSDGMRLQSKAHIIFGPWIDVNGNRRSTQGIYIGGFGGGTNHVAFTRSDGTAFMLRAEDGMDYGANNNISINDLNIFDSTHFWKGVRVHGNLLTDGYIAMGGSVLESSIQYDNPSGTMNFRVPGGRSGSYFWFNQRAISEGSFDSRSKLSLKNVKGRYEGNALREIVNTDIVEYSYKNDPKRRQLSPIIDDINKIKKYNLPDIINDGESVSLYAMGSLSWLAIKQLAQKLEKIEEKLDAIA